MKRYLTLMAISAVLAVLPKNGCQKWFDEHHYHKDKLGIEQSNDR